MMTNFSLETMQVRMQWNDNIKVLKKKKKNKPKKKKKQTKQQQHYASLEFYRVKLSFKDKRWANKIRKIRSPNSNPKLGATAVQFWGHKSSLVPRVLAHCCCCWVLMDKKPLISLHSGYPVIDVFSWFLCFIPI